MNEGGPKKSPLLEDLEKRGVKIVGGIDTEEGLRIILDKSLAEAEAAQHGQPVTGVEKKIEETLETEHGTVVQKGSVGGFSKQGDEGKLFVERKIDEFEVTEQGISGQVKEIK